MLHGKQVLSFTSKCWGRHCLTIVSHRSITVWSLWAESWRNWAGSSMSHITYVARSAEAEATEIRRAKAQFWRPASFYTLPQSRLSLTESPFSDPAPTAAWHSGLTEFNQAPRNPVKWLQCTALILNMRQDCNCSTDVHSPLLATQGRSTSLPY